MFKEIISYGRHLAVFYISKFVNYAVNCSIIILPEYFWRALQIIHSNYFFKSIQCNYCRNGSKIYWFLYFNTEKTKYDFIINEYSLLQRLSMVDQISASYKLHGIEIQIFNKKKEGADSCIEFSEPHYCIFDSVIIERSNEWSLISYIIE